MNHPTVLGKHTRSMVAFALFFLGAPLTVLAFQGEDVEPREGDTVGWHVIEQGDTLMSITEKYLGVASLWRENLRLNPGLAERRLRPGDRIRVIVNRDLPPSTAEVIQVKRKVEHRREPNDWQQTSVGNRLEENNTVRTDTNSSTELRFDDESRLNITEESLVFLQKVGTTLRGINRQSVEIKQGQADLVAQLARPDRSEIEILVGGVIAKPTTDAAGVARTRSRLQDTGNAEVMVYSGNTAVASGGSTVSVPSGMGTVVEPGQAPAPPEKLLPAAKLLRPARDAQMAFANPNLAWDAVQGAANYTVEICEDNDCSALIARQTGLTETRWEPGKLPVGTHYWRVTAAASSGLDGFPTGTRKFTISADRADRIAPFISIYIEGLGAVLEGESVVLGQGGGLMLDAVDDAAGIDSIEYRWNGGSWQTFDGKAIAPPAGSGEATLAYRASDNLGRVSKVGELRVLRDTDAPSKPELKQP